MKRFLTIISLIVVLILSFALFTACANDINKIEDYLNKIEKADNLITVYEKVDKANSVKTVTEVIISENRMQRLSIDYKITVDASGNIKENGEIGRNEEYYEVLDENTYRRYFTFECTDPKHTKGKESVTEWTYEDEKMDKNILDEERETMKSYLKIYNINVDNLVYSEEDNGFVFKDGVNVSGVTKAVVTAKSGSLSFTITKDGIDYTFSYMNLGTARVAFPQLCANIKK